MPLAPSSRSLTIPFQPCFRMMLLYDDTICCRTTLPCIHITCSSFTRSPQHWANTEVRLYQFASADDNEAELIPVKLVVREGDDEPTSSQMEDQE